MADMHERNRHTQAPQPQDEAIKKQANAKTEAEAKSIDSWAGRSGDSSHNAKSHRKAGSHEGAGGGKKQERHH